MSQPITKIESLSPKDRKIVDERLSKVQSIFGDGAKFVSHTPDDDPDWQSIINERCTFTDEEVEEEERFENEEPPHLTDLGNAQRFREMHIKNVRHSIQLGWLIWDGKRWLPDGTQENERLARETVKSIYQEAADCDDKEFRQKLAEWASKCESMQKINAMLTLAESEPGIAVRAEIFDRNPWLFNVDNGTLNLRTGELNPHSRDDLITKIAPIVYDAKAPCPIWRAFLERIFAGNATVIRYVQKVSGYCLTADTREHELYIVYGLGANGKTTLIKTSLRVLGEYGVQSPVETFLVKRNGGGIPNDVARLAGARFVAAMESEANQRLAESLVKALTGGDRIAARFLHKEFFEFEPAFKLILSTNHKPRIIGSDHAIWRRIRLIPFDVTIPKSEQDKTLPQKLEAELAGILNWHVEGCLLWQQEGLDPPPEVVGASESYRQEMDTLGEFLEACCVINAVATVTAKDLYAAYMQWLESNKDKGLSRVTFGQAMSERGFKAGRNWQGRYWQGVGLLEP